MQMSDNNRFLIYRHVGGPLLKVGYMHNLTNLIGLCREAAHLGRRPVLAVPCFDPVHNFGVPVTKQWNEYVNVETIQVNDISESGILNQSSPHNVFAVLEDDFQISSFPDSEIVVIHGAENGDQDAFREKAILVRELTPEYAIWGDANPELRTRYNVSICPSKMIEELAGLVADRLGSYVALHVRRGDRMKQNRLIDRYTRANYITSFISDRFGKAYPVFLMTDERKPGFFDALRSEFDLVTYQDFPALRDLVNPSRPDNFMLFCVEKLIYYRAAHRIGVFTDADSVDCSLSPYSMDYIHRDLFQKSCFCVNGLLKRVRRKASGFIRKI